MLLVLDVGNSSVTVGLYETDTFIATFRMATKAEKTSDEYAMLLQRFFHYKEKSFADVDAVMMSSVVPTMTHRLTQMCQDYIGIGPLVIGPGVKTGLNIQTDNPKEVGADRIASAVAAIAHYGTPAIVVDIGTATTFTYIDQARCYKGGVIAPGAAICAEALYTQAAKLPKLELSRPLSVIGHTTSASMQSGIYIGHVALIDGVLSRMIDEARLTDVHVIATGGLAHLFYEDVAQLTFLDEHLVLKGLKVIYEKNKVK
ncbi:type III pantothenate kinase [Shouchella lonarensis]|uniref:Type III pantothenate kinase n=1 Tax=Shouchella lonarensis TaxID=1464122 RepID=A0A1G6NV47_9BACI|nr:type III pantothenate kinase [Shouchella lonarensis]SDC71107.1 type III pantothenate kinase [Shouchella lonarensis]